MANKYKRLMTLARRYHERCERYDKTVCTGPTVCGTIQPRTRKESTKINSNSFFELEWTIALGHFEGFTEKQIIEAATEYWENI